MVQVSTEPASQTETAPSAEPGSFFELIGGEPTFRRLVDAFYAERTPGGLPSGAAGGDTAPAAVAPWEAGVVEADGKPLPTAPPPGPVPVHGIPQPAGTAPAAPAANDLVPAEREYLRPILVRYAQENGLPADLVMALAWVESSWRRSVVSDVGAVGVMQLMPDTVDYVSKKLLGLRSDLDPKNATIKQGVASLDSLIVGEGQIAGQVKTAYEKAQEQSSAGPLLHALHPRHHEVQPHAELVSDRHVLMDMTVLLPCA